LEVVTFPLGATFFGVANDVGMLTNSDKTNKIPLSLTFSFDTKPLNAACVLGPHTRPRHPCNNLAF
jgi:hypothetical protein